MSFSFYCFPYDCTVLISNQAPPLELNMQNLQSLNSFPLYIIFPSSKLSPSVSLSAIPDSQLLSSTTASSQAQSRCAVLPPSINCLALSELQPSLQAFKWLACRSLASHLPPFPLSEGTGAWDKGRVSSPSFPYALPVHPAPQSIQTAAQRDAAEMAV